MNKVFSRRDFLKLAGVGSASLVAMAFAACGNDEAEEVKQATKTEAVVGITQDPESLFPFLTGQTARQVTHPMIYQNLMRKDANNNLQPCIVKEYTKPEDHVYEMKLYDYVKDWNGNAITATDVLYSWKIYEESGRATSVMKFIDSLEVVDDYTFRVTTNEKETSNAYLNIFGGCNIFSQKSYEEGGTEEGFASHPVGSGRYQLDEWVEGSYITFKKWDEYWQTDDSAPIADCDLAYSETVKLTVITETSQVAIALETGEIDATVDIDNADWVNFVNDDGTPKDGYNAIAFSENLIPVIWMNCGENSILHDKRIRQAICYAIDMEAICEGLFGTAAYAVGTWGRKEAAFFDESWGDEPYYPYDVEKAKSLLAEAGYPDGGFTLNTCGCPADYADDIFLYVQSYLDAIGITVTINNYDSALFLTYRDDTTGTAWDMTVSRSTCPTIPSFLSFLDVNNYSTGYNAFYFNDPELQAIYDAASFATTYSEETVHALVEKCYDECYGYPCWVQSSYCFTSDKVTDVKLSEPKKVIPGSIVFA